MGRSATVLAGQKQSLGGDYPISIKTIPQNDEGFQALRRPR